MSISCRMSLPLGSVTAMTAGGFTTSRILSAISANWGRDKVADDEARTMLTEGGRRWRNSWRTKALSGAGPESPKSCCIRSNSWEGFRSPSSSAVSSCWWHRCSEALVLWMRVSFSRSYGCSAGGCRIRSLTSVATSGASAAMT